MRPRLDPGAIGVVAVVMTLLSGRIATGPHLGWYATLAKPSFNPPNWLFGPVWSVLYLLMAFAIWRLMQLPPSPARRLAAILFCIQLALNAGWSWLFFGGESPLWGLIDIVLQLLCVLATTIMTLRLDRWAGLALVPLSGWVAYAALLNAAVWALNR
jgi:tryptophan-rich sensory protein